jgi:O-antigen/teichoic acid export membrane protein
MKNAARQTIILSLSNFITRVLGMVFFIFLAKTLSVKDYSLFRYLITLASMFGLAFYGIPIALTKFLSVNASDSKLKSEYLGATVALLGMVFVVLAGIVLIFNDYKAYLILFIFAYLIDLNYLGYSRGLLDYLKLSGYKLVGNSLNVAIIAGAFLLIDKIDLNVGVSIYAFSGFVSLLLFEWFRWHSRLSLANFRKRLIDVIKFSIPVTIGGVGWTILLGITSIYLEKYKSLEQVGYYSVGATLMQTFSFLPDAIFTLLMPKIAGISDKRTLLKPLRLASLACLVFTLMLFIPLYFYREMVITLVFSEKYLAATSIILPLATGQLFLILNQVYGTALQGLGKPGIPSAIIVAAAGTNAILGFFFVRQFGLTGAAYSYTISGFGAYIAVMVYWRHFVRQGGLEKTS